VDLDKGLIIDVSSKVEDFADAFFVSL